MTQCPNCQAILPEPPERFCPICATDLAAGRGPYALRPAYPPTPGYPPRSLPPGGGGAGTAPLGGQTPWERRHQIGFVNALIETTKQVLSQPTAFFRAMPVTGGIGGPLLYAVIVGYIGLFASTIYNLVFRSVLTSSLSGMVGNNDLERLAGFMHGGVGVLLNPILGPLFIVIRLFVSAGIFHLVLLALAAPQRW